MRALPLLVTYESKRSVVKVMAEELALSPRETQHALNLFDDGLPPLSHRLWIPFLFGVSPKLIGAMGARSDRYYRRFQLKKRSGGYREIVTPRRYLKTVQRWLLAHALAKLPISAAAHGFVSGRSIFSNAQPHLRMRNVLSLDIQDFFPSVTNGQVFRSLKKHLPFPGTVASQIADLCTLDGSLPQGAPTSPALANAVFGDADAKLLGLAQSWGATYTRYADDIVFSCNRRFGDEHVQQAKSIIESEGFHVNHRKSRIAGPGQRQMVAGIVVNERGIPPRERRRLWRAIFHRARLHPLEFADRLPQLEGIAAFMHQYDGDLAQEYLAVVDYIRSQLQATS